MGAGAREARRCAWIRSTVYRKEFTSRWLWGTRETTRETRGVDDAVAPSPLDEGSWHLTEWRGRPLPMRKGGIRSLAAGWEVWEAPHASGRPWLKPESRRDIRDGTRHLENVSVQTVLRSVQWKPGGWTRERRSEDGPLGAAVGAGDGGKLVTATRGSGDGGEGTGRAGSGDVRE